MSLHNMRSLIERYWRMNRVPVGADTSQFVRALAAELDAPMWSVPSGAECLTWVIPPMWSVRHATLLEDTDEPIADFSNHPLYLKSYSAPFYGKISRAELREHLFTDPERPERICYDCRAQYAFGERKAWGFSLPYNVVQSLKDVRYTVSIDVTFGLGDMDVIDWTLPGQRSDTILLAAHTCHPAQVNDGIACVAVLVELFRWLQQREPRRYSYRLVLGPEYFTAAAMLARNEGVDAIKAGVFLDMPGNGRSMGFSRSFEGQSMIDRVTRNVIHHQVDGGFERDYRGGWGNDEMFYDGPDYRIPTVGLGRAMWPYYHTDFDDIEHCDFEQLGETLELLKQMVEIVETDEVLKRNYRGPLYQSRHDLYIDPKLDRRGYDSLQGCQILMNGEHSYLDIASSLDVDVRFVRAFGEELLKRKLADKL